MEDPARAALRSRAAACTNGIGRKGSVIGLDDRSTSVSARSTDAPSSASQCRVGNSAEPRNNGIAPGIVSTLSLFAKKSRRAVYAHFGVKC